MPVTIRRFARAAVLLLGLVLAALLGLVAASRGDARTSPPDPGAPSTAR
jgi:hypothetical protein